MTKIVDLTNDTGFETFISLIKEGKLNKLSPELDLDTLLQKQAYAEDKDFADSNNRLFCVATPLETYITAGYAEKCASELDTDVVDRIKEACLMFGIGFDPVIQKQEKVAQEMFTEVDEHTVKYAGRKDYGTELDTCLAARALMFPDYAEDFEKMASLKDVVDPQTMVQMIKEADEELGIDLPWVQQRLGTPEYAVFEKKASVMMIDLGVKQVGIEKLAELDDALKGMGVDMDFDSNDEYSLKLAFERLPSQIKAAIAKLV